MRQKPGSSVLSHWSNASLQMSVVHEIPSLQLRGDPPPHRPLVQTSPALQNNPSSQGVKFGTLFGWHKPEALQVSGAVQPLLVGSPHAVGG